jgi:hypothetical protein
MSFIGKTACLRILSKFELVNNTSCQLIDRNKRKTQLTTGNMSGVLNVTS